MHDVVAHAVSLMVLQLGAARMRLEVDGVRLPPELRAAEDTGREALGELRRTVGVLRETSSAGSLAPVPDLGSLPDLVPPFAAVGLAVTLDVSPGEGPLPSSLQLAAYRIVQEGLTNVAKHAGGVPVTVSVRRVGQELVVAVQNSPGRAAHASAGGHGLAGMRERVMMFGGTLDAGPAGNGGFRLVARLPVPPDGQPDRDLPSSAAVAQAT
jgi:signal transduction histidine kinase